MQWTVLDALKLALLWAEKPWVGTGSLECWVESVDIGEIRGNLRYRTTSVSSNSMLAVVIWEVMSHLFFNALRRARTPRKGPSSTLGGPPGYGPAAIGPSAIGH